MYGKYLQFTTLGSYVACLGPKVFKFRYRVFFGGFSAKDDQRPKLVSTYPQIPFGYEKCGMMGNSIFCKIMFSFVIVIFPTMSSNQFGISPYHREKLFKKKCFPHHHAFNFFYKSGSSTLTLAGALIC